MHNKDMYEILIDGLEKVSSAASYLGVSRSFIYKLIANGDLPSVKIGHSRRVPIRAVRELAQTNLVPNDFDKSIRVQ
jgi:excisionase family DNA binding protein